MVREINRIVIHCADTTPSMDVGVKEIRQWHVAKGWSDIGYHYVITRNGVIEKGRPIEQRGAHVAGHNDDTIGVCLVGGYGGAFDYTRTQMIALESLVMQLMLDHEALIVCGHTDLDDSKTCPNFNVREWWYN